VLVHLGHRPVMLVIADYNMPGMNGLQLSATIKAQSPHTQVMLITAYNTATLERQARAQQVDYYLPKPFDLDRFEQLVRAALT
jgi:two-component system response regulator (stage 0 sporulation protein F)